MSLLSLCPTLTRCLHYDSAFVRQSNILLWLASFSLYSFERHLRELKCTMYDFKHLTRLAFNRIQTLILIHGDGGISKPCVRRSNTDASWRDSNNSVYVKSSVCICQRSECRSRIKSRLKLRNISLLTFVCQSQCKLQMQQ